MKVLGLLSTISERLCRRTLDGVPNDVYATMSTFDSHRVMLLELRESIRSSVGSKVHVTLSTWKFPPGSLEAVRSVLEVAP